MSLDLLGGLGAALTTDKSTDHAQEAKPGLPSGDAGALFASLLAAIAAPSAPVAPAGVAATAPAGTGQAEDGPPPAAADATAGKSSGNQVVVLPGLRLPIMLQELPVEGEAAPQPQAAEGSFQGAGLGEGVNLAFMARSGVGLRLVMTQGDQPAAGSAAAAATLAGSPVDAAGAEAAATGTPPAAVKVAASVAHTEGLPRSVIGQEASLTLRETTDRPTRPLAAVQRPATPSAGQGDQQPAVRLAAVVADRPAAEPTPAPATGQGSGVEPQSAVDTATDNTPATPTPSTTELPNTAESQNTAEAPVATEPSAATQAAPAAPAEAVVPDALSAVAMDRLQAAARGAMARPHAEGGAGTPVDPTRIQAQVTRALLANGGPRGGDQTLTLQLEPEHLGKVEVRLVARGDRLEVTFTAETAEAQVALRESTGDLVRTLSSRIDGRWQHIDIKVADPTDGRRDSARQDSRDQERSDDGRRDPDQQERRRERRQNQ